MSYKQKRKQLRWTEVDSSNIARVRYWKEHQQLDVQFKPNRCWPGETFYRYEPVTMKRFLDVLQSESIGSTFATEIKAAVDDDTITCKKLVLK